jgi:DNA repair protein RadC
MQVKITKAQKVKLLNSTDIYNIMQDVLLRENKIDRNKEHFWTIGLDTANRLLYIELISLGSSVTVPAEPMQVFRVAVLKAAARLILLHNHPDGDLKPSKQDVIVTDRLYQVGNILGIEVIDHLIISEKSYNSFADTNLLDQIKESKEFVPNYKIQEQIRKEAELIGREKEKQENLKQLVQLMKKEKYTIAQIIKLTGLTAKQINLMKAKPKP